MQPCRLLEGGDRSEPGEGDKIRGGIAAIFSNLHSGEALRRLVRFQQQGDRIAQARASRYETG